VFATVLGNWFSILLHKGKDGTELSMELHRIQEFIFGIASISSQGILKKEAREVLC